MKRKSILMALAFLAVVALGFFVSCSNNIMDDVSDTLVWATFDRQSTRATSTYTQTVDLEEIKDVYWTYTATKADSAGQSGATSTQTAVKSSFESGLDGAIGPFSQGLWNFEVYGYKTSSVATTNANDEVKVGTSKWYSELIYTGSVSGVELKNGTQNNPDPIDVTINLLTSGTGTFTISNASDFTWLKDSGTGYTGLYLTMLQDNGTKKTGKAFALKYEINKYIFDGAPTLSWSLDAGAWNMTFSVVKAASADVAPTYSDDSWTGIENTYSTTDPALLVKVYTGQKTTLEAKIIEEKLAYGAINGTIDGGIQTTVTTTVSTDSDVELSSSITPAAASSETVSVSKKTKVTIPANTAGFTSNSTASLTVTAYPIVTANSMFSISADTGAVGAIDLKATVTTDKETEEVKSFKDGSGTAVAVTVETYVAAGMSNVTLAYTNEKGDTQTWSSTGVGATDISAPTSDSAKDGKCFYDSETGRLVFKTTHFSTFLVGAAQNVYDPSTNTAYTLGSNGKITDKDNKEKVVSDLGDSLVLFDCCLSNNVLDEWIKSVGNAKGKTWRVIHKNCDKVTDYYHDKNASDFSGGYGTKIEPYLIANKEQFQNITGKYNKYAYYKLTDNYSETDLNEWYSVKLFGSFDGNGKSFTNLTAPLFKYVGYVEGEEENYTFKEDKIKLKNFNADIDINAPYGSGLVFMIVNGGETTFEDITITGTITAPMNTGSFYAYGTANWDDSGHGYTVSFVNCNSSATLICTTKNTFGGFIGHGYEGTGNTLKINIDGNSSYTGKMYSTEGTGNRYIGMCSEPANAWYNGSCPNNYDNFYKAINGEENNKYSNVHTIETKDPTSGNEGYTVEKNTKATKFVVDVAAQLTAYETNDTTKIQNLSGITLTIDRKEITDSLDSAVLLEKVTSVKIAKSQSTYGYSVKDGCLTINLPGDTNYRTGTVTLYVTQYNGTDIVSCGSVLIMSCDDPAGTNTWTIE